MVGLAILLGWPPTWAPPAMRADRVNAAAPDAAPWTLTTWHGTMEHRDGHDYVIFGKSYDLLADGVTPPPVSLRGRATLCS